MKILFAFLLSFFAACLTPYGIKMFPIWLNKQVKHDFQALFGEVATNELNGLKAKKIQKWLLLLFPLYLISLVIILKVEWVYFCLISTIVVIILYLSLLDCLYFLTDIRLIVIIFILSLSDVIFFHSYLSELRLLSLFFTVLFFTLFFYLYHWLFRKEGIGSGDMILFCALSPLFSPIEMIYLLLYASLLGCFYSSGYFLLKKCKVHKLPFIPFITVSVLILFWQMYGV